MELVIVYIEKVSPSSIS